MGRKTTDIADIIALRLALEPLHRHVVDQALAKGADRAYRNQLRHHLAPCIGHKSERGGPSGQFQIKYLSHAVVTDSHATPFPRSGFVLPPLPSFFPREEG